MIKKDFQEKANVKQIFQQKVPNYKKLLTGNKQEKIFIYKQLIKEK
jgi:hypothetical protein